MSSTAHPLPPAAAPDALTRDILATISRGYSGTFAARLWTGEVWQAGSGPSGFTLVLKHPGTLRAMLWPKDKLAVGESYIFDDYDIEGDVLAFAGWLGYVFDQVGRRPGYESLKVAWDLGGLPDHKNPRDPARAARPTDGGHQPD